MVTVGDKPFAEVDAGAWTVRTDVCARPAKDCTHFDVDGDGIKTVWRLLRCETSAEGYSVCLDCVAKASATLKDAPEKQHERFVKREFEVAYVAPANEAIQIVPMATCVGMETLAMDPEGNVTDVARRTYLSPEAARAMGENLIAAADAVADQVRNAS